MRGEDSQIPFGTMDTKRYHRGARLDIPTCSSSVVRVGGRSGSAASFSGAPDDDCEVLDMGSRCANKRVQVEWAGDVRVSGIRAVAVRLRVMWPAVGRWKWVRRAGVACATCDARFCGAWWVAVSDAWCDVCCTVRGRQCH